MIKNGHWLVSFVGDIDVIKLLIGYDAVVSIKNDNEQTPREFASDKAKEPNAKGNFVEF